MDPVSPIQHRSKENVSNSQSSPLLEPPGKLKSTSSYSPSYADYTKAEDSAEEGKNARTFGQSRSSTYSGEKPKVVLSTGLRWSSIRSLFVHLIALAVTGVLMWLNFSQYYAWDQKSDLDGERFKAIMNALQFAAKIHEVVVIGSLSSIMTYHIRYRLLGHKGVPLGLLTAGFQLTSVEYLLSGSLWSNIKRNPRLTTVVALTIIYSLAVGPSSAIMMIPTLNWWPATPAKNLYFLEPTLLMSARQEDIYPLRLDESILEEDVCQSDPFATRCNGAGFDAIQYWAEATFKSGFTPMNLTLNGDTSNVAREMHVWGVPEGGDRGMAATITQAVLQLHADFWFIFDDTDEITGKVVNYTNPRLLSDDTAPIYGPLADVQCAEYDFIEATDGDRDVNFPGTEVIVDSALWEGLEDLNSFTWLDIPKEVKDSGVVKSIAALARVPYLADDRTQQSLLMVCTVGAYWTATSIDYMPGEGDLKIKHNITDPYVFSSSDKYPPLDRPDSRSTALMNDFGMSRAIEISTQWADRLNRNTEADVPVVESVLQKFTSVFTPEDPESDSPLNFINYEHLSRPESVAKILAVIVADGLAMHAASTALPCVSFEGLDVEELKKKTGPVDFIVEGTTWRGQSVLSNENYDVISNLGEVDGDWLVVPAPLPYRLGYGYGYINISKTLIFAVVILGIHAAVAIVHLVRLMTGLCRRHRKGRRGVGHSRAWGQLGEVLALALVSKGAREQLGSVGAGVGERETWRQTIRIREGSENEVKMLVSGDEERIEKLAVGKEYH